jgi:hypothetical protein
MRAQQQQVQRPPLLSDSASFPLLQAGHVLWWRSSLLCHQQQQLRTQLCG